jgi:probable phosphoglycerate mutase
MAQLWLIRHGETTWMLSGQHAGTTDIRLTARGEGRTSAAIPVVRFWNSSYELVEAS